MAANVINVNPDFGASLTVESVSVTITRTSVTRRQEPVSSVRTSLLVTTVKDARMDTMVIPGISSFSFSNKN